MSPRPSFIHSGRQGSPLRSFSQVPSCTSTTGQARFHRTTQPHHQVGTTNSPHRTTSRPGCPGDSIHIPLMPTSLPPRIFCRGISSGPASWPTQLSLRHSRETPRFPPPKGRSLRIALILHQTRCLLMDTLPPWVRMVPQTLTMESRSWMRTRISSMSPVPTQRPGKTTHLLTIHLQSRPRKVPAAHRRLTRWI